MRSKQSSPTPFALRLRYRRRRGDVGNVSPHKLSSAPVGSVMTDALIALSPAVIWAILRFGAQVITSLAVSVGVCILTEFAFSLIPRFRDGFSLPSAVVTGCISAMLLPPYANVTVFAATAFTAGSVKTLFGGIGKNPVNPSLTAFSAISALYFAFSGTFFLADGISSSLASGSLPKTTLIDCFLGNRDGAVGCISAILLILGGIYLAARHSFSASITVPFLAVYAIACALFPRVEGGGLTAVAYELLASNILFCAVFSANDPVTTPTVKKAKTVCGILCGLITFAVTRLGIEHLAAPIAVTVSNLLSRPLDTLLRPCVFGHGKKRASALPPAAHESKKTN